ncbi:hypothetical protein V6N13_106691 [Hibiscus sabdariffa]|uniref:Uncharacterized protein n=1 Tax=Hibiscus sabdariffa TaxID=183260 RepID=A0ABR2F1I4_9ROSI
MQNPSSNVSLYNYSGDVNVIYNNPLGVSDMDVDCVDASSEKDVLLEDESNIKQDSHPNEEVVPGTTKRQSYASMVAGSQDRRSDRTEEAITQPANSAPLKPVLRNTAYMASNPDKKAKSSNNWVKGINVVSMNNGQATVV